MSEAILQRWNGFLSKIEARHQEICQEFLEGMQSLSEESPTDARSALTATQAFHLRVVELDRKLENTFSEKVAEALRGSALGAAEAEFRRRSFEMGRAWERVKVQGLAHYFLAMEPHIQELLKQPRPCTQCGADMQVPPIKTAKTVVCEHCDSANQVSARQEVAYFYSNGPDAIAEYEAQDLHHECERARFAVEQERNRESDASVGKREALERAYWEKYAAVKARYDDTSPQDQQRFIESRVKMWRDDVERSR